MITSEKGINLIHSFEGCHSVLPNGNIAAYLDPVGIPTIGWGTTRYPNGEAVKLGDIRTRAQIDEYFKHDLRKFEVGVEKLVKVPLTQNQFDALVSFSYNLGLGALQNSTLLRLLNNGDYVGAGAQFERWNKAGNKVLPGLVRRRDAETRLFGQSTAKPKVLGVLTAKTSTYLKKSVSPSDTLSSDEKSVVPVGKSYQIVWHSAIADNHMKVSLAYGAGNWYIYVPHWESKELDLNPTPVTPVVTTSANRLDVKYFSQRDNRPINTDTPDRICFSSSCAMAANYLLKGEKIKDDTDYIKIRSKFGDTTLPTSHLRTLEFLGLPASYHQNWTIEQLISNLKKGYPVPVGILHRGPAAAPRGGGHWICVVGFDSKGFIVHDPWGEIRHSDGTYQSTNGKFLNYSYALFDSRWTVASDRDGWVINLNPDLIPS